MKKGTVLFVVMAFLAAFSSAAGQPLEKYPTNTSLGYKGVVMANFDPADAADEVVADFGAIGLWYYNDGNWTQLSGLDPEGIIAARTKDPLDDELVADFGAIGLWYWDGLDWTQLSGVNAEGLIAVDDDGGGTDEIQVDFGALGVWRFQFDDWAWLQYSGLNPVNGFKADLAPAGREECVWNFPTAGMWAISANGSGGADFRQLTGAYTAEGNFASARFIDAAGPEDIVADLGPLGLWLCQGTDGSWVQISAMDAKRVKEVDFQGDGVYELLAEDSAGGLFWGKWNGTGMAWTLITGPGVGGFEIGPGWCEVSDARPYDDGDEEVIIPLKVGGAYRFDYSENSTLELWINAYYFINYLVRGDYYGMGRNSTFAYIFGANSYEPGLWLYEGDSNPDHWGWAKISPYVPDGMY